jgi:hypothetical protein
MAVMLLLVRFYDYAIGLRYRPQLLDINWKSPSERSQNQQWG